MPGLEIGGATALVTGASRGFGRGIAAALRLAGAQVTGLARDPVSAEGVPAERGGSFPAVAAYAADPNVAGRLIDPCRPRILVLNAGATPATAADPAAHLGDVRPQLGRRRPARVRLDPGGAA